ncbi:YdaU family protein [Roseicitreum antarcticum]|uniref:YdaU family protein n=1 Tax=Roseicitreum antarcticum TaxID=564137 RepID=UPI0016801006|nr:YdaU family protein [Roseicitreum antarcticum]
MSQDYNPKKARTKYACPIWVDAFVRDTMDLAADEFGAYHLILYAMWSREELNMPDDDRKLARLARCSQKMWRARIRPALEPFFDVENGYWTNVRLTKEATKTEKFLRDQSDRKRGSENSGNALRSLRERSKSRQF